jgi:hypothetical protein
MNFTSMVVVKWVSAASALVSFAVKVSSRSPKMNSSGLFPGGALRRKSSAAAMVRQHPRPSWPATQRMSRPLPPVSS